MSDRGKNRENYSLELILFSTSKKHLKNIPGIKEKGKYYKDSIILLDTP